MQNVLGGRLDLLADFMFLLVTKNTRTSKFLGQMILEMHLYIVSWASLKVLHDLLGLDSVGGKTKTKTYLSNVTKFSV